MNRKLYIILSTLFIVLLSCHDEPSVNMTTNKNVKLFPEGVWIAKDFYTSFEKSKSIIASKNAFDNSNPVGLRINYEELNENILNIGYSFLHDHLLRPEVSKYAIDENMDTIREQGSFQINLANSSLEGKFETTEIYPFCYEWKANISYNEEKDRIKLFRPQNERYDTLSIEYIRIDTAFEKNYLYPNPLYFYTRKTLLIGEYVVKNSIGQIVSERLKISKNGKITGMDEFEGMTIYYSTDVYCGPPSFYELIFIDKDILNENAKSYAFEFKIKKSGNIELYKVKIDENGYGKGKLVYTLEKYMNDNDVIE